MLLAVAVSAASVPVAEAMGKYPRIETLFVDNDYAGQCAAILRNDHGLNIDVVRHPANRNVGCWRHPDQGEMFPVVKAL